MSRLRDHDLQPDAAVSPKKNTDPHMAGLRRGRAGAGSLGLRSPFPHRRLPEPHPARNSPAPSETPSRTSHRTPGAALARPPTGLTALWPVPITGSSRDRRPGLIASCPPTAGTTPVTRETLKGRSLACSLSNGPARPSGGSTSSTERSGHRVEGRTSCEQDDGHARHVTGGGGAACRRGCTWPEGQAEWPRRPGPREEGPQ